MLNIVLKTGYVYRNKKGDLVRIESCLYCPDTHVLLNAVDTNSLVYEADGTHKLLSSDFNLVEELFECHGRDDAETIRFYESDYYVFSSFSSFSLKWAGMRFDTLEAAYHYSKFDPAGYIDSENVNYKELARIRGCIYRANSAHEAFQIAQKFKDERRPDWDKKEVKVRTMFQLIIEKVKQHEYVKTKLLKTYGRRLVEDSWRDWYWGSGSDDKGLNVLGQLWMLVRTIVETDQLYTINPLTYPLDSIIADKDEPPCLPDNWCETADAYIGDEKLEKDSKPLRGETHAVFHVDDCSVINRSDQFSHCVSFDKDVTYTETYIKVPLPKGVEDTPEIRQKMTEFLLAISNPTSIVDVSKIRIGEG